MRYQLTRKGIDCLEIAEQPSDSPNRVGEYEVACDQYGSARVIEAKFKQLTARGLVDCSDWQKASLTNEGRAAISEYYRDHFPEFL